MALDAAGVCGCQTAMCPSTGGKSHHTARDTSAVTVPVSLLNLAASMRAQRILTPQTWQSK